MATEISKTYRNPTWANAEKTLIQCEIVINLDDGSSRFMKASVSSDSGRNPDWNAIIEKFGVDAIDEATTADIVQRNAEREKRIIEEDEQRQKDIEFRKQEDLFAMKLEAFEIEEVKNSTNRDLKARIRKSKTLMEVQSYTTILIMKEMEAALNSTPSEPQAE